MKAGKDPTKARALPSLLNNPDQLGEDAEDIRKRLKGRLAATDRARVKKTSHSYGCIADQKVFNPCRRSTPSNHTAHRRLSLQLKTGCIGP
jgi:hypothetical protein